MSAASAVGLEPGSVASLPPHLGVVLSPTESPGVALLFPWVLRIPLEEGPSLRPSHLVIEPGVVSRAATSLTARVALRWLRAALSWLALGGGLGMGVEAAAQVRAASSIELVARLGKGPFGFALITARLELRADGTSAWLFAAGATYW